MILNIVYLIIATCLGLIVGWEREIRDKPAGLRTITFITLGAALSVIFTKEFIPIMTDKMNFDSIRLIAYYIVALGFVGGGITAKISNRVHGITTASLLLPMAFVGLFCGLGKIRYAVIVTAIIFIVLKLKGATKRKRKK